jgi:hypothetical protein
LELAKCPISLWSEDAVNSVEVKSEPGQPLLQGPDVVTGNQPTCTK